MENSEKYDMIVIGAGHAGCEAALAGARMGCRVLLLAADLDKVAAMPCSPSIGGMAKGQLVRELDALGGEMARVADKTAVQYKVLNTSKGPAVRSTRTQNDKNLYHRHMKRTVESQKNLELKQTMVNRVVVEGGVTAGVEDNTGFGYSADAVVIAAGTFLSGLVHIGPSSFKAGRAGEFASYDLARSLKRLGFETGRMKTGTPPRLKKASIDFSRFEVQPAEKTDSFFSFFSSEKNRLPQLPGHMGRIRENSIAVVRENLHLSPLYSGAIQGVSARYCPSFEDKVVKFADRTSHKMILQPEGTDTEEIYASGLGNSLPPDIQIKFVRSIAGLEQAEIMRPAYAIEYDYVNPVQLKPTLETKKIAGLFLAGQINGTSGYEEAAAQGLWAGINAALRVQKKPPFVLDRSEAYMAVMVDDLVTRGTREPYRMFTSRAEYRLVLREDNADLRLTEKGYELGLISKEELEMVLEKKRMLNRELARMRSTIIKPSKRVNEYLEGRGTSKIETGVRMDKLLKRAELDYAAVNLLAGSPEPVAPQVARQAELEIKYEGYVKKQLKEIEKFKRLERIRMAPDFDYSKVHGLSNEMREKLSRIKPASLGQASRIEGVTPAAISVLMVALKARRGGMP